MKQQTRIAALLAWMVFAVVGSHAEGAGGLGPLKDVVFEGEEDGWVGRLSDESYQLDNRADPGGIRYFYAGYDLADEGKRTARVTVAVKDGGDGNARAGLLYGLRQEPFSYYLIVAAGDGQVEVYRRDDRGVNLMMSSQASDDRPIKLEVIEHGKEIEVRANGNRLSSFESNGTGGGAIGIAAMGLGSYTFSGYEQVAGDAPAKTQPPQRTHIDTPTPSRTAAVQPATNPLARK